ncbi:MAG: hypothetical protein LBG15_01615 [Dysgonamonadaceae bacterium]|jgi:hypothetical protein|nr:hypothetical protein [Dysgonamonadaceae bacterium]
MRRITNSSWNLFPLVVLFATFSCNHEEIDPNIFTPDSEGDVQEVAIKINVPFEESSQLRSIGPTEENTIQTIDVLAFRVDGEKAYFDYSVEGKKETDNTINAVLWTRSYQQCLVIITNARDKVNQLLRSVDPVGWKRAEKNAMLEGLEFSLTQQGDKWNAINASDYTAFPMWGESEAVTVTKQTAQLANPISLLRMVAKINVQLDETVTGLTDKFKMKSVRLYNTHTRGSIIPKETENGIVTKASVPVGAEKYVGPLLYDDFSAPGKEDVAVRGSIYTFETVAVAANKASEATCLVVGGYYNNENKETYYRLDFINEAKEFIDILRNHQYTVNIKDVTGSGYNTPEEAFEAKSTNMSVDVLNWNEDGMYDVVFDGQFFLSVSRSVFNFSLEAYTQKETNNVLTVFTNYKTNNGISGWYIEKIVDAEDNLVDCDWLSLVDNEGNSIEQGEPDVEKEIILYLDQNDTGDERTAVITFASGRLRYAVRVTQTTRELTSINFFEGYPNENGSPIDTLKFYHGTTEQSTTKRFTVRWTPENSDLVVYEAPVQEDHLPVTYIVPELRVVSNKQGCYDYTITLKYDESYIGKATSLVFLVSNGVEIAERKLVIYYYPPE